MVWPTPPARTRPHRSNSYVLSCVPLAFVITLTEPRWSPWRNVTTPAPSRWATTWPLNVYSLRPFTPSVSSHKPSKYTLSTEVDWQQVKPFSVLGIDEIALTKGQGDYVAVLTARRENGEVEPLAVLVDRKKETVRACLETIPKPLQRQVLTVCTDMWACYIAAVREALPKAVIVIDRFHVAKQYRAGADTLRKSELKRLRAELGDVLVFALYWFIRNFRESRPLRRVEDAVAQQIKAGTTKHRPLDHFEPIDVALGLTIAPL